MNTSTIEIREVLFKLNQYGLEAIVAGGYVRDMLLGIESKDVDYFILNSHDGARDIVESSTFGTRSQYYGNYENNDMRDDVIGVTKIKSKNIDFVYMKTDLESTLYNFDVSICQCLIKLVGDNLVVYATKDFLEWQTSGIIYRYVNIPTSHCHLTRIKNKFNVELTESNNSNSPIVEVMTLL